MPLLAQAGMGMSPAGTQPSGDADYTLRIAPVTVELDPSHILSTIGYNGTAPGPVLRMREGKPISVDVINETDTPELVHWHGMLIPAEVDGTERKVRRWCPTRSAPFAIQARSGWIAMVPLACHGYGRSAQGRIYRQFGFVYVDAGNDPATTIRSCSCPCAIGTFFTGTMDDDDDDTHDGPLLEKPATLNTDPAAWRSVP